MDTFDKAAFYVFTQIFGHVEQEMAKDRDFWQTLRALSSGLFEH